MNKIKIILLCFLFIPFFVCAETCDKNSITIKSIEIENKSDGANEKVKASVNNNNISLNLSMDEVSDVIEYKVIIKNTSKEDFIIDKNAFNKNNNYIKYTIYTEDDSNVIKGNSEKEVLLKVEYENEVPDDMLSDNKYNDNKSLIINLTNDKDGIINPYTGNINRVIILISVLLGGLFLYLFVNKKQPKLFILFMLLLPLTISATCVTSINVESNVQINKKEVKPSILMQGSSTDEESNYLRTNIKKKNIETITFINSIGEHTVNGTTCFDVSRDEDGSVLAWVSDNDSDGLYEMTIGAKGKVYAVSGKNLFYELNNVTGMYGMEYFDTSLVTNMSNMFGYCFSLPSIDLSHFDTSNVTDMSMMFSNFSSCETIDISSFDTSKVTNMRGMFATEADGKKSSIKQIIGLETMNTSNVTNMEWMFVGCEELTTLDLSNFDTSKVTNMNEMLKSCRKLKTIYANDNFDTSKVTESNDMFYISDSIVGGNGTIYDAYHVDKEYARVDTEDTPGYFTNKNSKTATIYYNSSNTLGELNISSKKVSCVPSEGSSSCTINIPSIVTSSVGKYNSEFKGISDELNNLSNANLTINTNKVFYAYYSSEVTNYYYDNSYKNRTIYRNEYLTSLTDMNSVLSASVSGTQNYSYSDGPGSSEWTGLSNEKDNIVEYNNISDAARSNNNTFYSVYRFNVTFEKGSNVNEIGSTGTSCYITSNDSSCSIVLPSIIVSPGYKSVGWNTTNGATTGNDALTLYFVTENNKVLYANAINSMLMQESRAPYSGYLKTTIPRKNIETITFTNSIGNHTVNGTDCFDVSKEKNGTVLAWAEDSDGNELYELTIGSNGKTYASNGKYLFFDLENLKNINGLEYLDTSLITSTEEMFAYDEKLESLDVSHFDTSKVTTIANMFYCCMLLTSLDLSNFDTLNVTNMSYLFYRCESLTNLNISVFNTSKVTNMHGMFYGCYSLTDIDLSNFDTSNVRTMNDMFHGCKALASIDLSPLNTSNVTNMSDMFSYCENLTNIDLSYLDTSKVTNMNDMFAGCKNLTSLDVNTFVTSQVTTMSHMFSGCEKITTLNLENFDTTRVVTMNNMFSNCINLTSINLSSFNTSSVKYMTGMFYNCSKLSSLDLSNFDTSNVTSMGSDYGNNYPSSYSDNGMFEGCSSLTTLDLSSFSTEKLTNIGRMFRDCKKLTTLILGDFKNTNVKNMIDVFYNCQSLTSLDLSNFKTDQAINMSDMFYKCSSLTTLDLSSFNTSNVTTMRYMFYYCNSLIELDLSSFDTSQVTDMSLMFYYCQSLKTLNLSNFNTSQATDMSLMFYYCQSLESLNISNFNTSNVIRMGYMFYYCNSLTELDLSSFDTSKVTTMEYMFHNCKNLVTIYASNNFVTINTSCNYMFSGCTSLVGGNGTVYNSSNSEKLYARIDTPETPGYFTAH